MNIIIVGCGKVGRTLAEQLSNEKHNIVIVDIIEKKIQDTTEDIDIMGFLGNAASINTLLDAGIETGGEIGDFLLGLPGKVVGGAVGSVVGAVGGAVSQILFNIFG